MNRAFALLAATAATGVLFFAVSPAAAQDRATFTGPRVEATVGYDSTHIDNQPAGAPNSVSQARLGVAAGYDWAIGTNWTLGGEIGVGGTLGDGRDYTLGGSKVEIDQGRDFDASVRLGYKVGARTLVYGKAGWANSRYVGRVTTGGTTISNGSNENGFRAGAGVERMLNDHIYAKGEYRYTSYGHGVDRHQLLAGVGYRF
jgi:outer membrane immunogenic protein